MSKTNSVAAVTPAAEVSTNRSSGTRRSAPNPRGETGGTARQDVFIVEWQRVR